MAGNSATIDRAPSIDRANHLRNHFSAGSPMTCFVARSDEKAMNGLAFVRKDFLYQLH